MPARAAIADVVRRFDDQIQALFGTVDIMGQRDLVIAQLTIVFESGHAFTPAQAVQLIKLIQAL